MERSVKCPVCNKPFIPAPKHVYRQEHKRNGALGLLMEVRLQRNTQSQEKER